MTHARLTTWMLLAAGLLALPSAARGQLQLRPAMQGSSGLNSIPPMQGPPPFGPAWGYNPSWYYGIRHPPGYSGYYPGYYSYSGYTSPFEPRDYPRYYRGLAVPPLESPAPGAGYRLPAFPPAAGLRPPTPGASTLADRRVYVEVRVPADAEVWFDGAKTSQAGAVRHFYSPPLGEDPGYTYHVRARWAEGGREVDRTRPLPVVPGRRYVLDFVTASEK